MAKNGQNTTPPNAWIELTNGAEQEKKNIWFGSIFTKFKN